MRPLVLSSLLLLAGVADAATGVDGHGFAWAPNDGDAHDGLATWRPERQNPWSVSAGLLFEYADSSLMRAVQVGDTITRVPVVDDLFVMGFGASLPVHERIAITLNAPIWLAGRSEAGALGAGIGDITLHVPVTLLDPERTGFGLSVVPMLRLPSGRAADNLGQGGVGAGLIVPVGYSTRLFSVTANAGFAWAPRTEIDNLGGGPYLLASLAGSVSPIEDLGIKAEIVTRPPLVTSYVGQTSFPAEAIVSASYRLDFGLFVDAGGAVGITRGAGTAAGRAFLGVGWVYGKGGEAEAPVEAEEEARTPKPAAQTETTREPPANLPSLWVRGTEPFELTCSDGQSTSSMDAVLQFDTWRLPVNCVIQMGDAVGTIYMEDSMRLSCTRRNQTVDCRTGG